MQLPTKTEIAKLSKREKLQLLDAMEEYERRKREKGAVYTPHREQRLVHVSKKPIRAVFSGNGAGKTTLGANEAIWGMKGWNPVRKTTTPAPSRGIVVLDSPTKVPDQWLPELRKWTNIKLEHCHKRGKPHISMITDDNGSEILFMFHDQAELLFESIEADWIIFDEPPPRKIYISLMRGLRKADSQPWILFLGTPITAAWMRKELYEPWAKGEADHIECFRFDSDANKANLNWDWYQKVYFRNLTDKEIQIRRHGQFFDLEGLALAHLFDRELHLIEPFPWPSSNPCTVVIDPHPRKNHVAILLGVDRKQNLYYIKEMSSASAPRAFARELKAFYKGFRVVDIVCDSLGNTPGTGGDGNASFMQVLKSEGVRCRSTTFKEKDDEDFIQKIQQVLEIPEKKDNFGQIKPRLQIFRGNKGIIDNVENVEWLKYKNIDEFKPKLNITNRDFLACLKYGLASGLIYLGKIPKRMSILKNKSPWGKQA